MPQVRSPTPLVQVTRGSHPPLSVVHSSMSTHAVSPVPL
jgi:hypothetical protein